MKPCPLKARCSISAAKAFAALGIATLALSIPAYAVVFSVPKPALSSPVVSDSTIVHFDEIVSGTPINGQTIKGFTFSENIPNAIAANAGGPGSTLSVTLPIALSGGGFSPATYVLTVNMPAAVTSFGFDFAILDTVPTANAVTISLFDGVNNLGALTYGGTPDPTFDGGFAGIGSSIAFTSAKITFGPTASAFAIDNVAATGSSSVPDSSSTGYLLGFAFMALFATKVRFATNQRQ